MGCPQNNFEVTEYSELSNLQDLHLSGAEVTGLDLVSAIRSDVQRAIPISEALFSKFLQGKAVSITDIQAMVIAFRGGMEPKLFHAPELFLNYCRASVLCVRELERRAV